MFWGLVLKANKKYSQTVQKAFHLSQAALDLSKCGDGDVQVMLTSEENTYLLCTLGKKVPQVALDLNFEEGDQISLSTKGEGVVHLTGYLVPSEEDFFGGDDDEELEEEEEVEASPQKGKGKERIAKKVAQKVNAKEVQLEEDGEEDELDETFELKPKGGAKKGGAAAEEEEDSDDDDDDDEDDEDEDMDESKVDGEADSDDDDDDDDEEDDDDDDEDDDDEEDESEDEQPKAKVAKVEKKAGKQNGVENGKASSKELKKEGQKEQQQQESKTRTLQGGLVVEDLRVGNGPEAKPGKKLAVYYEGRLKKNNKVFDARDRKSVV